MKKFWILLAVLLSISFVSIVFSQERRPLSVADIEELLIAGVSHRRIAEIIEERGVNFEVTEAVRESLKRAGAGVPIMQAVEKAGLELAKKKLDEARQQLEERRRRIEEEERRKVEAEKKGIEEARQKEEQQKKLEEARRRAEEEKKKRGDGAEMVLIPPGEFWMGSEDGDSDEKPRRRLYLDAFYIDKYEVTNALYRKFMEATGRQAPSYWNNSNFNGPNQPGVGLTWYDAEAYCRWAGKRLPTEAEWEKAARGTDGRKYPWGNEEPDGNKANYGRNLGKTAPVGSYLSGVSPYGVHDMAGNVWEWVADWYGSTYYRRALDRNPKGPESGQYRVLRGGSWYESSSQSRSSRRFSFNPKIRGFGFDIIGFRCAQ